MLYGVVSVLIRLVHDVRERSRDRRAIYVLRRGLKLEICRVFTLFDVCHGRNPLNLTPDREMASYRSDL